MRNKYLFLILLISGIAVLAFQAQAAELIWQTQGAPTGVNDFSFGPAASVNRTLIGWVNDAATSSIVLAQPKKIQTVRLWLTLYNNPAPSKFFLELHRSDTGELVATSSVTQVNQLSGSSTGLINFGFNYPANVLLLPDTSYYLTLKGLSDGRGTLGASRSSYRRMEAAQIYFEIYGSDPVSALDSLNQSLVSD